jgi:hypothetical protein
MQTLQCESKKNDQGEYKQEEEPHYRNYLVID